MTSDIETLAQFFQWGGLALLLDVPLMLLVGAVMLAYNWVLALVAFALAAPLTIVLRIVQRRLVVAYEVSRERNGDMMSAISEIVGGAETIRAYGAGAALGEHVGEVVDRRKSAQIRAGIIGAMLFPSGEVFSVLTVCGVVVVGVWQGPASGLTAGAMIGFLFLTYRFLEPIAEFTEVLDQTQTAVAGLRRVLGVLDLPTGPPEPGHPVPLPPGVLDVAVRDVTFAYPIRGIATSLDEAVLRDVDVSIPAGQQVALVGATGSGKTTLGRLIARFADPTVGEIALGGVPLHFVANDDLRRRLVVVSQEPFLFDDSIAANVGFAKPGTSIPDIESIVRRLELDDWIGSLPDGLMTVVGERGRQPVGGGAPARGPVPRRGGRPRRAAPRRGDIVGRRPDRGAHLPGIEPAGRGAHDHRHRPPSVDGGARRPHPRPRRGCARRGRDARRVERRRRGVRPAVRRLDGRHSGPRRVRALSSKPNGGGPVTSTTWQVGSMPTARAAEVHASFGTARVRRGRRPRRRSARPGAAAAPGSERTRRRGSRSHGHRRSRSCRRR